jgi:hypothetical protein
LLVRGTLRTVLSAVLPVTGAYTLALCGASPSAPVAPSFTLTDVSAPSNTLTIGSVQGGTLAPGQRAQYTFTLPSAASLYFENRGPHFSEVQYQVLDASNAIVFTPFGAGFRLGRAELDDAEKVSAAVRAMGAKMPTYITLKDVKKRWGHGQEDVLPVAQFEKLWGDMTGQPESEVSCGYAVVPRARGQQLKDPAQLDGWLRDGSAAHVESLCEWE